MEEKYREVATVILFCTVFCWHIVIASLSSYLFFFSFEVVALEVVSRRFLKKKIEMF